MRKQLLDELSAMQGEYDRSLDELNALHQTGTDGAGDDQADAGSKTFEREQELSIAANRLDLLNQIQRAIERVDAGTYGAVRELRPSDPEGAAQGVPDGDTGRRMQAARGAALTADAARHRTSVRDNGQVSPSDPDARPRHRR